MQRILSTSSDPHILKAVMTTTMHAECGMNVTDLSLSQFINNLSDYLTNETTLIFSPGNHGLESELTVENVHSFSMFMWPGSSSKAVITCHGHNARFEFSNVRTASNCERVGVCWVF